MEANKGYCQLHTTNDCITGDRCTGNNINIIPITILEGKINKAIKESVLFDYSSQTRRFCMTKNRYSHYFLFIYIDSHHNLYLTTISRGTGREGNNLIPIFVSNVEELIFNNLLPCPADCT